MFIKVMIMLVVALMRVRVNGGGRWGNVPPAQSCD
jgi:hypothetical protein